MDYLKKEQESGSQRTATMETRGQEDCIFSWPKELMSPDYTSSSSFCYTMLPPKLSLLSGF